MTSKTRVTLDGKVVSAEQNVKFTKTTMVDLLVEVDEVNELTKVVNQQIYPVTCFGSRANQALSLRPGERVTVVGKLGARHYNGRYYLSLRAEVIEATATVTDIKDVSTEPSVIIPF